MSFVIGNSVALAWCFEDEQTAEIMELLDRVVRAGAVAPQLWPIEAFNGLLIAERRGRISGIARRRLAGFLRDLPIRIDDETVDQIWTAAAQIAELHQITAYDACYVELAVRLGLPLATADNPMMTAARNAGVEVLRTG